jgi:diguanylate cyclase (GGDEF)-like protein
MAAGVSRLALFHHDPTHDDDTVKRIEESQQRRAAAAGSNLEIFAAAEGAGFEIRGKGLNETVDEPSALERRPISGSRVLVVTDQRQDMAAIEHVLPDDDLLLTQIPDGQTAVDLAADIAPDLVIVSSSLPDGDGAAFIQPLRNQLGKPELPILLVTEARDAAEIPYEAANLATDYLAKPLNAPMLRTRVRSWLTRTMAGTTEASELARQRVRSRIEERTSTLIETLGSMPIFSSLTNDDIERLIASSTEFTFPSGHVIINQGETGSTAYVVIAGRVRILESVPDSPVEVFLGEMGSGEIFGELGMLRARPRTASVVALERTRCLAIPGEVFLQTLQSSTGVALSLLHMVAGRLHEADRLLARHAPDPLTGLPGRRAFHDLYRRLAAAARRKNVSALLMVFDVKHLKEINDRFGYAAGDDALRVVSDALMDSSRTTDLVARYGGDEFAALLIDARAADVPTVIQRIQQNLVVLGLKRGLPFTIEVSAGYSFNAVPPDTADELLRLADEDMHSKMREQAFRSPGGG